MLYRKEMDLGCVILAGGKSSRMGQDKALLSYQGGSFLEGICSTLDDFTDKYIARGPHEICPEEIASDWKVIGDNYDEKGPLGGLEAALSSCKSKALFVTTCDMPLLQKSLVGVICRAYVEITCKGDAEDFGREDVDAIYREERDSLDALVVQTPDGRIHPLCGVYHTRVLPVIRQMLEEDNCRLMRLLDQLQVSYLQLDDAMAKQVTNVNTREDLQKLEEAT